MSSSDTVLEVRNLSKLYRLGEVGTGTLSHDLNRWWARIRGQEDPFSRIGQTNRRDQKGESDYVWALKDVNFEVRRGEVLGIIGANGAGKSTLLKLISRITAPTTGHIRAKGRIASLLEVGTGMHPEMTARENIYLNGALLGTRRREIARRFDEILDFAGCTLYVDTPVKRYSSGMRVRLGFAVAAFLEPEILILDEVLAVGDAEFQRKCIGKMHAVAGEGRTILFVSHNLGAVERLCSSLLIFRQGEVELRTDNVSQGLAHYIGRLDGRRESTAWTSGPGTFAHPCFTPLALALTDETGKRIESDVSANQAVYLQLDAQIRELDPALTVGYAIYDEQGETIYWSYHTDRAPEQWPVLELGRIRLRSQLPCRLLNEGQYRIELLGGLHCREWLFRPESGAPAVHLAIRGGLSDSPMWMSRRPGILAPSLTWERTSCDSPETA